MKTFLHAYSFRIVFVLVFSSFISLSVAQCPQRYIDYVFKDVKITTNINYGGNKLNTDGTRTKLAFDIYEPKDDTAKSRPLIVYMHGGGFTNFPPISRNSPEIIELGADLAKRGYVVISPSYRLFSGELTYKKMVETVVAAAVDINSLLCQLASSVSNGNPYRIDTNRMLLGGSSAGAVLALNFGIFLNDTAELEANIRQAVRRVKEFDNINLQEVLNNKFCGVRPKGIISISGGFIDTNLIKPAPGTIFALHGKLDFAIPYTQGPGLGDPNLPTIYGPGVYAEKVERAGIELVQEIYDDQGHVPLVLPFGEDIWKAIRRLLNTLSPINKPILKLAKVSIANFCYSVIGSPETDCLLTGIRDNIYTNQLIIAPNPSSGIFRIEMPKEIQYSNMRMTVFDVSGRKILDEQTSGSNSVRIDLSLKPKGIYILGLSPMSDENNAIYIEKLLVQ